MSRDTSYCTIEGNSDMVTRALKECRPDEIPPFLADLAAMDAGHVLQVLREWIVQGEPGDYMPNDLLPLMRHPHADVRARTGQMLAMLTRNREHAEVRALSPFANTPGRA